MSILIFAGGIALGFGLDRLCLWLTDRQIVSSADAFYGRRSGE
jgi:hypothetical protein